MMMMMSENYRVLPAWRNVIVPQSDVSQGNYRKAEFAADLSQVSRGEGSIEYLDPVEFFGRTYVTEGMRGLLVQAMRRVTGGDGEPVIQLKTAFGGGKTHSMLALYHLMRSSEAVSRIPGVRRALDDAGVSFLPKVNVAVLVGTSLDPTRPRVSRRFPGLSVNTLWGEMALQFAENAGDVRLYDYVRESDARGVSPGSEVFRELLDACGPCLVLMDEIVAYARKLREDKYLPAGTFDNFLSFMQEITEAARSSRNSIVVASIPESDIEVGGENGKKVLESVEHIFGRMESIWKPVAASEGFEIVRRRLFNECQDDEARRIVANSFSRMYNDNAGDFPAETREAEYRDRIISCYPIHPEFFDRLYGDWATLERFQRTRGVLRLMAAVIHELWMTNDNSALIMPGSIPLDVPNVRDELIRHLPEGWNAIIDKEVDGKNSVPYQKDKAIPHFGSNSAARRVARTIMLGSAPTSRAQAVRGIGKERIRLGVIQPGENVSVFNDALTTLQSALAYLYTDTAGSRFWYDTRPTLRKTVEERARQFVADPDVKEEIERRLSSFRREKPFAGVHVCPGSSLDVPDEQAVRLVVLGAGDEYSTRQKNESAAVKSCAEILNSRGNLPRVYRNMLAFLAPDQEQMENLRKEARLYLAWKSIENDSEALNLDAAQNRETKASIKRYDEAVGLHVREAWCCLLVPYIDRENDIKTVNWEALKLNGGNEPVVPRAARRMEQEGVLITRWAASMLKMELDGLLWRDKDDIAIKTLWDYLCTYCYLPRLSGYEVLEEAVMSGLSSGEFALAEDKTNSGGYTGIKRDCPVSSVNKSSLLVRIEALPAPVSEEEPKPGPVLPPVNPPAPPEVARGTRHFTLHAALDITRINRDVKDLAEEVISHMLTVDGGKLEISLTVEMSSTKDIPHDIVRTVSENCNTLKFTNFSWD